MKKLLLICILFIAISSSCFAYGNESQKFLNTFYQAVIHLRFERFKDALPLLYELDQMDPENPNVKYLIGVCYVATNTEKQKAVDYLENAIKYRTNEYAPSYYLERRTPIYSLYYLGVCYCSLNRCEEAKKVFEEFTAIISDNSNDYVQDARGRLKECASHKMIATPPVIQEPVAPANPIANTNPTPDPIANAAPPASTGTPPSPAAKKEIIVNPDLTKGLKIHKVVFHKQDPLYSVQIGAFAQKLPNTNFPNLKNVKSFVDKEGVIRYIVGGTAIRSTAEILKSAIITAGYKDAFIVDITEKAKFDQEVLNAYNMETSAMTMKKWAKLEYKVQIGAYRTLEKMNEDMAWKFIQIEGIELIPENGMTLLTVGGFGSYEDAGNYKKILVEQGVTDAFVIVYKNGQKTSIKEAGSFTSKDF